MNIDQYIHRVELSSTEHYLCQQIGELRHRITSQRGKEMKQDEKLDGFAMSVEGVITEYATAKALNLHFDMNCDYRNFGADLYTQKGKSIDVKCVSKQGGDLNAVGWSVNKAADVYILTEIYHSSVGIVGWVNGQDFLVPEYLKEGQKGPFYSYPRNKLRPIDEFIRKTPL